MITDLTPYRQFQLERYGNVLPETIPWEDPNEETMSRLNDYRLSGAELQAEVISEDLFFTY